ncbi:MAG TPA: CDP-glucose 4,6-dehydratase [Longimicrobium sp.]|jgi:CDP-glucose 4,6-dehydratase
MEAFGGVFRGRRVFVTGHTGFKGGWLALWLAELGAEVHGYALEAPTTPSLFADAGVEGVLASHTVADVRDAAALRRALLEARPEVVIHMAAQPLVRLSYDAPAETYEVNVMGTVNLLDAVRAAGTVRVCQVVTSDKCYENREWVYGYRENDPMGGFDPYSSSKGCAELVVSAYRRSFFPVEALEGGGASVSSVRAGNVIGGGDWALDRIVPDCVRALARGESILVRNPRAVRPWQHVLEPLAGYLHLAATQLRSPALGADGWNFGPSAAGSVPVAEIVDTLAREWGGGGWHTPEPVPGAAAPHEAHLLKLDITKAQTLLGWRPVYEVHEAVAETTRWYRARHEEGDRFDGGSFCRGQIARYQARAAEVGSAWAPRPA